MGVNLRGYLCADLPDLTGQEVVTFEQVSVHSQTYVRCQCGAQFYESGPGLSAMYATLKAHESTCTARLVGKESRDE
jgi:hypothetical protein